MLKRTLTVILSVFLAVAGVGGYVYADINDVVPGFLTNTKPIVGKEPPLGESVQLGSVVSAQMAEDAPLVEPGELAPAWEALEKAGREQKFTPGVYVADALTGEVLLDKNGQIPMPPASTIKILTAINAAQSLDPADTLATRIFLDEDGVLHLVGEGDLLLAQGAGGPQVNGRAGVADLAAATAKALEDSQRSAGKLVFHDHMFDGPTREPALMDGLEHWVGHVAPFAIDRGELPGPGYQPYYDDPAANVAQVLQDALASAVVNVEIQASSEPYDGQGELLAKVESAPIAQVTRLLLMESDNTLAEQLCRLSSVAQNAGSTLEDAALNLVEQVKNTGVYTDGLSAVDCSGLNVENRVSPRTLVESLLYLRDAGVPAAFNIVRDLPVGHFSGTLNKRFEGDLAGAQVNAKTGTLDEVSSLAGFVMTKRGRVLAFHVQSSGMEDGAVFTRPAIDDFALALAKL